MANSETFSSRWAFARPLASALVVASIAGVPGLVGCTQLAPGSDQLDQGVGPNLPDAGPPEDPMWACLYEAPAGGADRLVSSVELSLRLVDSVTNTVPEGLSARACSRLDVMCDRPAAGPVSPAVDGAVHLSVTQGFAGYVEITFPLGVSTLFFLNRPLMRDRTDGLALVNAQTLGGLAAQASLPLDPMKGGLLIRTFDCTGAPASDIELSTNVGGVPFVFVDGLPNVGADVTSPGGVGGFVNVPVGYAVLQGRHVRVDRVIGTANVLVRPGWFTYGDLAPP